MFELVYIKNGEEITRNLNVVDLQGYLTLHKNGAIKFVSLKHNGKEMDFESIISNLKL